MHSPDMDAPPPDQDDMQSPPTGNTTVPLITVPDDITEEATSPDGAQVSFEVFAQDAEDGVCCRR